MGRSWIHRYLKIKEKKKRGEAGREEKKSRKEEGKEKKKEKKKF